MTIFAALLMYHVIFFLTLLCLRVKAFTAHLCLAGRIYWRFERTRTTPNKTDTVYTLYAGPISFVVVR